MARNKSLNDIALQIGRITRQQSSDRHLSLIRKARESSKQYKANILKAQGVTSRFNTNKMAMEYINKNGIIVDATKVEGQRMPTRVYRDGKALSNG